MKDNTVQYTAASGGQLKSLGSRLPEQLAEETDHALRRLKESLGGDVAGYVADRLRLSPEELAAALASEQVDGVALAIYNIEGRSQSVIIGDQTGIGKGRQAAAMIRYGILAGYLPIFLTDRYTLFSDMYRDCKALGIKDARPLVLNQKVSVVDFDHIVEDEENRNKDEEWTPDEDDDDGSKEIGLYQQKYEEVYHSPLKKELELMYKDGDIPKGRFEYLMLTYSQLKDAKRDRTRLEFLTELCRKHRVLFIFDEAHKSSSVSEGNVSVITQGINSLLEANPETQCLFLSATFAKRPECLLTFMKRTVLSSLASNETLQLAFANGGVPMQEYVASKLAREGQMIRREHSNDDLPEPVYTYLDEELTYHIPLFDKVMSWFRELVKLSDMVKRLMSRASLLEADHFKPYPTRAQLFYINKVLLLSLKAADVAKAAVKDVREGKNVVIGLSDTLECILRDSINPETGRCDNGDFSTILLRLLDKTLSNPKVSRQTVFDLDFSDADDSASLEGMLDEIRLYSDQIRRGIKEEVFHLPVSPIDIIRQLITQETYTDLKGVTRHIRFEECTGRARQLEYLSPEGDDDYVNVTVKPRKKRHSNHIFNDFQNNKLDVILINACGAIGASAHAVATAEVPEEEVRQRKMLIVQNDLDVNIDLQKRGRINRTGQVEHLPPLYEYIITGIPSEKRLNMMLRAKLRSLSANTTANQDQDKRQADFVDITNKYGNLVSQEYLGNNPDLALLLGLSKKSNASQFLARLAMLNVNEQQDIIEEVINSYQNLEDELRRLNQWDLEREFRDFEAEYVDQELFTAPIDDTALGGASMITTFKCRHRTYPYDSKTLMNEFADARKEYGKRPGNSVELQKEINTWYRKENKRIVDRINARRKILEESLLATLQKYIEETEECKHIVSLVQLTGQKGVDKIKRQYARNPKVARIVNRLKAYCEDMETLATREHKERTQKNMQKQRLMRALGRAEIGKGYMNIMSEFPVEGDYRRVMAVLKEIRFGETEKNRFLPGKVRFVFALSAVHKELVLNLVANGKSNNYDRLDRILHLPLWSFNAQMWDKEIARYNNRIIRRKIVTGNILGAYAQPLIQDLKPRFVSFSLAPDSDGVSHIERGLLLPLSATDSTKKLGDVALPLADALKFATGTNHVYPISGIGVDFAITPSKTDSNLYFYVNVAERDSRKFESDSRFDVIRQYFVASPVKSVYSGTSSPSSKRRLMRYATPKLKADSAKFIEITTLLASLKAVIMVPRDYLTVGEVKGYTQSRPEDANSNWPVLDWRSKLIMPPVRKEVAIHISAPPASIGMAKEVEEFSPSVILARNTIAFEGRSLKDPAVLTQIRALYLEWMAARTMFSGGERDSYWRLVVDGIVAELQTILTKSKTEDIIHYSDKGTARLQAEIETEVLTPVGETIRKFREEYLFLAPPKEEAQIFLDSCLCDPRLSAVRLGLQNYIDGKTDLILEG